MRKQRWDAQGAGARAVQVTEWHADEPRRGHAGRQGIAQRAGARRFPRRNCLGSATVALRCARNGRGTARLLHGSSIERTSSAQKPMSQVAPQRTATKTLQLTRSREIDTLNGQRNERSRPTLQRTVHYLPIFRCPGNASMLRRVFPDLLISTRVSTSCRVCARDRDR